MILFDTLRSHQPLNCFFFILRKLDLDGLRHDFKSLDCFRLFFNPLSTPSNTEAKRHFKLLKEKKLLRPFMKIPRKLRTQSIQWFARSQLTDKKTLCHTNTF